MRMEWSAREREFKRRAAKKDLIVHKSPIDGTFMVDLRAEIPLFPEKIKTKPWGKRTIEPPAEEIYEAATLEEAEAFVERYTPPWSSASDPELAAAMNKALGRLGVAASALGTSRPARPMVLGEIEIPDETLWRFLAQWRRNPGER
jgi:hypothetical protein